MIGLQKIRSYLFGISERSLEYVQTGGDDFSGVCAGGDWD